MELDLLLLPFYDEVFPSLSGGQQETFAKLLEEDDPDLLFWFSEKGEPEDPDLRDLIRFILDRVQPSS